MPEGPEIRRAADAVRASIGGSRAFRVWFRFGHLKDFERRLTGRRVKQVEARGKALLIHFTGGLTVYSHNQLYGRWFTGPPGEQPETGRTLRLAIETRNGSAHLFSASEIEVLDAQGLRKHRYLTRLGPDPLQPDLRAEAVAERLRDRCFNRRRLGGLLLDQGFLAGLGNYLRCEILFAAGLHPSDRSSDCRSSEVQKLSRALIRLPRQSYRLGGITNVPERAKRLQAEGYSFEDSRFLVFRRGDKPCYRCGAPVQRAVFNGRPCYLCPGCQTRRARRVG